MKESVYLDRAVSLLNTLLEPDVLGNAGVLSPERKKQHLVMIKIRDLRTSFISSPPSPKSNRDVVDDLAFAFYPHVSEIEGFCFDMVVGNVGGLDYSSINHEQTVRAIAINLFHNQPRESGFLSLQPKHSHYKNLALYSEKVEADKRLFILNHVMSSIHELIEKKAEFDSTLWKAEKPSAKKRVAVLAKKVDVLRKELDSLTTLGECWHCQKTLDITESEYDEARLKTIPPECSIKLVGAGFKVGVEAIWLENLVAPFQLSTVNSPSVGIQMNIGGDTRGEQAGMGLVNFRADGIYLRTDNFPKSIRLESFSARCEFISSVPMTFKEKRMSWKVGSGLRISLKKIEPKMTTTSGNSVKPPQTLIRFIVEQVLKLLIASNLKKTLPHELGQYFAKVKPERMNSINGHLSISGPHAGDLEAPLINKDNESSLRGRKLLSLTREQAISFVSFASNFCKVDFSTTAKIMKYVKIKLNQEKKIAPDLLKVWQASYDAYCKLHGVSEESLVDIESLFCTHGRNLSRNPIDVKLEMHHIDVSLETQTALKGITNFLTRVIYESFGGRGVVYDETEELTDNVKKEMKNKPSDYLLSGVRKSVNGVLIPLRRSLLILGNHLTRLSCSLEGTVDNVKTNTPADLRIDMNNVEILCTPSLPSTLTDFLTRNYLTTIKQCELEGQRRRKRFMFELVKEESEGGGEGFEEVKMKGFFQNMRSKVVYDPLAMMEQKIIGMVELELMKSCWKSQDNIENTEIGLRGEGLSDDIVHHQPLLLHFNSELVRMKCKFMVILQELVFLTKELLLFGGSKLDAPDDEGESDKGAAAAASETADNADDDDDDDDDDDGGGGGGGDDDNLAGGDKAVLRDLSDKIGRCILIVLRIVAKHTSMEHFKFILNSNLRVSTDKGNNIVLNFEGNAASRDDQMPLELQWTTTFVDIVDDFKEIIGDFRRGRSGG
eukprot:CAMPEP_0118642858 /NCGR_PEP_ID=MMETSP0785-20121206/6060_1 /TAXON_ID=91992 /ORGANISM="Bolidomonas pacifica, Strain CCMP 1866" /LENGTH=946 /DNA_ID=CAMNT_0006534439 /DNA_START=97 /DNA_END=2934 /DNA_ORIENTATION=-